MSDKNKEKKEKTRNWATVVYPESAPENWREILAETHIPAFISPLHDKDTNPTGEPKKAHYHVMLMYEGPRERSLVEPVFANIGGVGCEYVKAIRGYARYLCHLDNPEKAQYSVDDVQAFGGALYTSVIGLPTDKYKMIREMIAYCEEKQICAYSDLLIWSMENREDWFQILCDSGTYVMKEYLKSKSWKLDNAK